jgi:hypothetical protein
MSHESKKSIYPSALAVMAIFSILSLFASCNGPLGGVRLREDPVISMKSRYGVVNFSYVRVKQSPSSAAEDAAYVRQADIVEVHECQMGKDTLDEERGYWYRITADKTDGWVFSGYLSVYNYRSQAERTSRALKEKSGK